LIDREPGVQLDQQGSSRINIQLRDANGLFGTSAFVIMDYRSLVGAGIGTFDAPATALSTLDLAQVELVRGPGSALYGPGVTSGVVHFITKDPFTHPGTSFETSIGDLNTFKFALRHAGHNDEKTFGYKFNVTYNRADEWGLDITDPTDRATISTFQSEIVDPIDGAVVRNTGGRLADNNTGYGVNGTVEFRPSENLSITGSAGWNYWRGLFWNEQGEGLQQANDYFTQVRLQSGGLFAQVFWNGNYNNSNDLSQAGFLYRSGQVSFINRDQLEGQVQYGFDIDAINTNIVVGGEYRGAFTDTETRVYGRNEDDDDFAIVGGYAQTKTQLGDKLDLVLAARYDAFLGLDETSFSPRAALVYKPNTSNTFRVTYNRAFSPNSVLVNNIDFKLADLGAFDIWLYGNKNPQTFPANNPVTWFVPGLPQSSGLGMEMGTAYAFITGVIAQQIAGGNPDLQGLAPLMPALSDPTTVAAFAQATGNALTPGVPIDLNGNPMNIQDVPTTQLRSDNTFEIGYKGVLNDKWAINLDVYNITRANFTQLQQISPLIVLPNLATDLSTNLTPFLTAAFQQQGMDPATAAATAQLVAGAYGAVAAQAAGGPLGTIETEQVPEEGVPHVAYGYRTYGEVSFWGSDIGVTYYINPEFSLFANYSWLSQTSFSGEDLGEEAGSNNVYALNVPQNKARFGFNYASKSGAFANLAVRYNEGFTSTLGLYSGEVEERMLIDAGVGYKMDNGMTFILNGTNITGNEYRTFPGFPKIGRRMMFTVRYEFQ
jgi:iron complex outermembrane receptor protein